MLHLTETTACSDETGHTATRTGPNQWAVSWLPGRTVPRWQAVGAIQLAAAVTRLQEQVGTHAEQRHLWALIDGWAAELGMPGVDAATAVTLTPTSGHDQAVA